MTTKKSLAIGLAALLMVLAVGCGKQVDESGKKIEPQPAANSGNTSSSTTGSTTQTGTSTTNNNQPTQSFFGDTKPKDAPPVKANLEHLKIGDPAKVGPLTVTVEEKAVVTKAAGMPQGYNYVVMKVTIKNDGKEEYTINSSDHLKLETPEGKTMPLNVQATAQKSPRLQGTLEPGKSSTGWLGYLVKVQDGTFKYHFIHPDYGEAYWEFAIK